jgi:DNA gyrase subunit A
MDVVIPGAYLFVVTAGGHGKRTPLSQFPIHNRGVSGVMAQKLTPSSGLIATARVVRGGEEAMVVSASGIVLRTPVSTISVQGRAAQGVALMNLKAGDRIACVGLINGHDGDSGEARAPGRGRGRRGTEDSDEPSPDED